MIPFIIIGGLILWSRSRRPAGMPAMNTGVVGPSAGNPFVGSPSDAASAGGGVTNPLDAFTSFASSIFAPAPYVPLSGPGGATTSPAGSPSPAGTPRSPISPDAPGTWGAEVAALPTSLGDPAYGQISGTLGVMMDTDIGMSPEAANLLLDPSLML
jgi:hypothetical protein